MNEGMNGAREVATVLAALRLFQREQTRPSVALAEMEHFADAEPLTNEEIDALCERINFGGAIIARARKHR